MSSLYDNTILLGDSNGVYIPQMFVEQNFTFITVEDEEGNDVPESVVFSPSDLWTGCKEEDLLCVAKGPEEEWYWEAWDSILGSAKHMDKLGVEWSLSQDGDLWAHPLVTSVQWPGEGSEEPSLDDISETLSAARKLRLEGRTELAKKLDRTAESALITFHPQLDADELMTCWELSLEEDPRFVPEWGTAIEEAHELWLANR